LVSKTVEHILIDILILSALAVILLVVMSPLITLLLFPSYTPYVVWGAMHFMLYITYDNGWLCSHNWICLSDMYRFCTKCHRLEVDSSYGLYGEYVFKHPPNTEDLKKKYKKEHNAVSFILCLLLIEFFFYCIVIL